MLALMYPSSTQLILPLHADIHLVHLSLLLHLGSIDRVQSPLVRNIGVLSELIQA